MKYLKEYKDHSIFYIKIEINEYEKIFNSDYTIDLTDDDYETILSYLSDWDWEFKDYNDHSYIWAYHKELQTTISRDNDEYYYIHITNKFDINVVYKCDELKGFIECLKMLLKKDNKINKIRRH
jgi:hypothetical protein